MSEWISTSERLPPTDGELDVLAYDEDHPSDGVFVIYCRDLARTYTHWQPLPSPPPSPPTKDEALREAVLQIELIGAVLDRYSIPASRLEVEAGVLVRLLPRLRAALGET